MNKDCIADPAAEPERSDVVHDLLAHMAEQMIALNKQRQKLERALDPFKWLDRGAEFKPFTQVFADEIKYGVRVSGLDEVHHDVEKLRLVPGAGNEYELQARLKHRDPATGWAKALKDDKGKIVRSWVPAYRFELDPARARFYTHALPVLGQFSSHKNFPGGKTKTTLQKLHAGRLPIFDPAIDLTPLEELTAELAAARARIMRTDELIDQIVYKLYGLTEEEIGIVEGGV